MSLNNDSRPEKLQRMFPRNALHLNEVRPRMAEPWIGEHVLKSVVIGEEEQALALGIESAGGIDSAGEGTKVAQGGMVPLRRELGENAKGFVEEYSVKFCGHHHQNVWFELFNGNGGR